MALRALMACLLILAACETLPTTSRTGAVEEVQIGDRIRPADVRVHPGDEVWFVNTRSGPIWIVFDPAPRELSCRRDLAVGAGASSARIEPGGSGSLCFVRPGRYPFHVRTQPTDGTAIRPDDLTGAITVAR